MLGRILNVLLLLPTLVLIIWFIGFYPIVGYIMGRGFSASFEVAQELIEVLFERSALRALVSMTQIVRYGTYNGR